MSSFQYSALVFVDLDIFVFQIPKVQYVVYYTNQDWRVWSIVLTICSCGFSLIS